MEPRDPPRLRRVRRARQLLPLGAALALIALASPAPAQDVPTAWSEFAARFEATQDPEVVEATLFELAAWYAEVTSETTAGLEEPLYRAAWQLASHQGWPCSTEDRLAYWDDAARFRATQGQAESASYMAFQGARLLYDEGRLDEACARTERILDDFADARGQRPVQLLNLAEWRRQLGEYGAALAHLEEYEEAARDVEVEPSVALRLPLFRALTYIDLGLPDHAAPWAREALEQARARRDLPGALPRDLILANRVAIHVARSSGDLAGAFERIEACLADEALYANAPAEAAELRCMAGISHLGRELSGEDVPARGEALVRASLEADSLGASMRAYARFALVDFALRHGDLAKASEELDAANDVLAEMQGGPRGRLPLEEEATLAALRARLAVARGDDEAARAVRPELEAALDRLLARWSEIPELEGGVGFLQYGRRRSVVGDVMQLTLALDGPPGVEHAFAQLLRVQAQGTLARRDRVPVPSVDDVRTTLLGTGGGLLAYLPADGASHVFALDAEGIAHAFLEDGSVLERLPGAYMSHLLAGRAAVADEGLRTMLADRERGLARSLADAFLPAPIRERVRGWRQVTIVGTDTLGLVPFAWLPLDDEPFLGNERALAYVHSIPLAVDHARRPRADESTLDLLLVTGVEPRAELRERWPELGPIPPSDGAITGLYAPARTSVLEGSRATLEQLAAFQPGRARVLQFLGHAVQDFGSVRPTALVFAPTPQHDGLVRCEDVEHLTAPELVILTACRSGQGPQRRGDPGVGDMGGAFATSGARAVVLTQADLTYEEARRASRTLHDRLNAGLSPAEGLRALREELVRRDPEMAPFRGGLLRVVGLGHEAPFAERATRASAATTDAQRSADVTATAWPRRALLFLGGGASALVLAVALARRRSA